MKQIQQKKKFMKPIAIAKKFECDDILDILPTGSKGEGTFNGTIHADAYKHAG